MRARIVSAFDQIGLDERGWNELTARSDTNTVFQTHEWALSWWEAFGDQYEPFFVTVSDAAGIAGVAPLVVERGLSRERVIRFLGDGRADYCDVLAASGKREVKAAIFDALFASKRWDVIELNNVPAQSTTVEIVGAICDRAGYRVLMDDHFVCPTLLIQGHEETAWKIFNKPGLRRRQNYFERSGRLVCRHLTSMVEIEPYLDQFFSQHVARWHGSKSPSLFTDERNRLFYRELTANLTSKGWILFSVVEFDDRPIAFHYGFDYNAAVLWYKPSFDVTYAARSPGLVLVRQLIGYAIEQKRRELDFTVGDEPFKSRFTNSRRKTVRIRIFRNSGRFLFARGKRNLIAMIKMIKRLS